MMQPLSNANCFHLLKLLSNSSQRQCSLINDTTSSTARVRMERMRNMKTLYSQSGTAIRPSLAYITCAAERETWIICIIGLMMSNLLTKFHSMHLILGATFLMMSVYKQTSDDGFTQTIKLHKQDRLLICCRSNCSNLSCVCLSGYCCTLCCRHNVCVHFFCQIFFLLQISWCISSLPI